MQDGFNAFVSQLVTLKASFGTRDIAGLYRQTVSILGKSIMTYRIQGLNRTDFEHLFVLSDNKLAAHNAVYGCFAGKIERY
jgi:hypothetical protein